MSLPNNIFLVGFMASGKTHVGELLSRLIGWEFIDADVELVDRDGRSIPQIFQEDGEDAFRDLERSLIKELASGSKRVIAGGGGSFVDPENREQMLSHGLVLCLRAEPETIHRRISEGVLGGAESRPLLAGTPPLDRIKDLLAQRAGSYAKAHHTIDTDLLTTEQVAQEALRLVNESDAGYGGKVNGR